MMRFMHFKVTSSQFDPSGRLLLLFTQLLFTQKGPIRLPQRGREIKTKIITIMLNQNIYLLNYSDQNKYSIRFTFPFQREQ